MTQLGFLPVAIFNNWKPWVFWLGCGGLACFFLAWIFALWEN
jgi:hypothetical protein